MARMSHRSRLGALACFAGLAIALPTHAQDALGDGRALDSNLQVGSGGRNPDAIDFRRELAYRNAIVTGNVPGGFAFRGDVGYSAANDFRGATAADDIFNFQRDAFLSGLGTRGLGGINAIQSSLAYAVTGQSNGLVGNVIVNDPGAGVTAGDLGQQRIDIYATIEGTLRTPSALSLQELQRPTYLNSVTDERGRTLGYIGASDLLGVRPLPPQNAMFGARDEATEDQLLQRLRDDPLLSTPDLLAPDEPDPNEASIGLPTHEDLLRSLGLPTSIDDTIVDPLEADDNEGATIPGLTPTPMGTDPLAPVREALREAEWRANPFNQIESEENSESRSPFDSPLETEQEEGAEGEEPERPQTLEERIEEAIQAAEQVLGRSVDIKSFRTSDEDPVFKGHVDRGAELLQQGRYFDAEERFSAALALLPGDPVAAMGRVHAQIGAGMFLSAGSNLRRLYTAYPEMIAARVDPRFLPTGERLDSIRALLRSRMDQASMMTDDAALLLAYIGVQTDTRADIEDGLERFKALTPETETSETDTLARVLEAAWLSGDPRDTPEAEGIAP